MEKRSEKRIKKRIITKVGDRVAVLIDISRSGIQISMPSIPSTEEVDVEIQFGEKLFCLRGNIRWVKRQMATQNQNFIGIAFKDPPVDYTKIVESLEQKG